VNEPIRLNATARAILADIVSQAVRDHPERYPEWARALGIEQPAAQQPAQPNA